MNFEEARSDSVLRESFVQEKELPTSESCPDEFEKTDEWEDSCEANADERESYQPDFGDGEVHDTERWDYFP